MATDINRLIAEAAARHGIPEATLRRYVQIESGGDPSNVTGSYKGLLQLSDSEFRKHGGSGNIFDPAANLNAGAIKLAAERNQFQKQFGRPPNDGELYLIHQQGWGGIQAHLANPDQPAWKSMASTAEGRQKGERWAKLAISGNVPKQWGVDPSTLTSGEFVRLWTQRASAPGALASPSIPGAPYQQDPRPGMAGPPDATPSQADAVAGAWGTTSTKDEKSPTGEAISLAMRALSKSANRPPPKMIELPTNISRQQNQVAVLGTRPVGALVPNRRA